MTKTITTAISTKATKRSPSTVVEGAFADITPGVSIRLYGEHKGYRKDGGLYDLTFKIGDVAEYDSYNLNYLGTIEKITAKTVTIRPRHGEKVRRLQIGHDQPRVEQKTHPCAIECQWQRPRVVCQ